MRPRRAIPRPLVSTAFTTRTAAEFGVGEGRLRGSDLSRPFHGIRSVVRPDGVPALASAFELRMPASAFFCGVTAALIIGIPLPVRVTHTTLLHVGTPAPMRANRSSGTVGHKLQVQADEIRQWGRFRVTTPARTWCDLATLLDVEDLAAAGDYIIHYRLPLASRVEMEATVARHPGRRGRARLLEALTLLDDRADSPPESVIRVTIVRAGIPGLVANHPIRVSDGRTLRADLCFPGHKVIFEYHGDYHRTEQSRWRKDRTRVALLAAAGWHVIEIAADELEDRRMLLLLIRETLTLYRAPNPATPA
jgi:hypothetical protein